MISLLRIVSKLPIPTERRLQWQRTLIYREFSNEISAAKKLKDYEKIKKLKEDQQFEIDMIDEEVDAYLTKKLRSKANKLHVPIPHVHNKDGTESEYWYEGRFTGRWYLAPEGCCFLREAIRREIKAQQEIRAQWIVWISATTGLIGASTALIALLLHKLS